MIIDGMTKDIISYLDTIWYIKNQQKVIYADHELDRINEISEAGYIIKKAYKEVGAGDSSVNERTLYFDAACEGTFQCMLNMLRQQDKDGNYIEKHIKQDDHFDDAVRYAIHGYKRDNLSSEMQIINNW